MGAARVDTLNVSEEFPVPAVGHEVSLALKDARIGPQHYLSVFAGVITAQAVSLALTVAATSGAIHRRAVKKRVGRVVKKECSVHQCYGAVAGSTSVAPIITPVRESVRLVTSQNNRSQRLQGACKLLILGEFGRKLPLIVLEK